MRVDPFLEDESSEEELERSQVAPLSQDPGYDSCGSEDLDSGFQRYREINLASWLGLRLPCQEGEDPSERDGGWRRCSKWGPS